MKTLGQDLRGALRLVTGNPGFATAVVVTFAIGIGANTAIFSFVHALLLRPLPFREADRLVWVRSIRGGEVGRLSRPELEDVKRLAAFEDAAGFHNAEYNLAEGGAPEALAATLTTANLFELLGVELLYGETWPESHDRTRQFSIVLNHGLWRRRFGGDPAVVGTSITLANAPGYTIVGILPPGFTFPTDVDLFRSIGISPDPMSYENRESRGVLVIARLAPDVSYARARAELSELAARLERSFPESNAGITFSLQPLRDAFVGDVRPYLLLLTGAAGFVLLMAATNVVNLLLSRGAARSHELALRRALGASRGRLARQLVVESLVLALAGGAFGCVLAWGLVRAVDDTLRIDLPFWLNVELSFPVLAFTIVVSIAAGVLAGAAPALSTQLDSQDGLKDGVRGATSGRSAGQLRRVLVASQIAFALVLLAGAGLMVRTFIELQRVDLGFNPENLLTLRVDPPWNKYGNLETITPFYRAVLSELQSIPGVEAAATNQYLPLPANQQQEAVHEVVFTLEGQSPVEQQENPFAKLQLVSPSYFDVMGIPLLRGRLFDENRDLPGTLPVCVVSAEAAERLWPGEDPIGNRILLGRLEDENAPQDWLTVVGVVGNVRHAAVTGDAAIDIYGSHYQRFAEQTFLVVRTRGEPLALAEDAKRAVWRVDPDQAMFDIRSMEERIADTLWQFRIARTLLTGFALVALLLATIGVFGVTSHAVGQRTRDFGIRMALGARPWDVARGVLASSFRTVLAGGVIGLVAAIALGRALTALLFNVGPSDPVAILLAVGLLLVVAAVASWIPARRAARVDPVKAMHQP